MGVDGRIFPVSSSAAPRKQQEGELGLKERWYPIQVQQKDKVGRPDIDAFEARMMREDCEKGFFVSFDYSSDALQERLVYCAVQGGDVAGDGAARMR